MKYDFPAGSAELEHSQFSIYPSPAQHILKVETKSVTTQNEILIMDMQGKIMGLYVMHKDKILIDISKLPSGIYLIKMTGENGVQTEKFIKQN
jgi:hypothetical protein